MFDLIGYLGELVSAEVKDFQLREPKYLFPVNITPMNLSFRLVYRCWDLLEPVVSQIEVFQSRALCKFVCNM